MPAYPAGEMVAPMVRFDGRPTYTTYSPYFYLPAQPSYNVYQSAMKSYAAPTLETHTFTGARDPEIGFETSTQASTMVPEAVEVTSGPYPSSSIDPDRNDSPTSTVTDTTDSSGLGSQTMTQNGSTTTMAPTDESANQIGADQLGDQTASRPGYNESMEPESRQP